MMDALLDYPLPRLKEALRAMGEPTYRAEQVFSWLHSGAERFDQMTNLPKALQARLTENYRIGGARIVGRFPSAQDDTVKYLFSMDDGERVEGVLLTYRYGRTLCISTQVGCRMGCAFCASTLQGCARNLTAGEMLGQIIAVNRELQDPHAIGRVVLMGSGEPLDNYDNTVAFLRLAREPGGLNIGIRNISLSTCGLVEPLYRFMEEGLPVTLSLSLHAPNDELRRKIMPVAARWPLKDVMAAVHAYVKKTGRRAIIEYVLIRGFNDGPDHAQQLARLLKGLICHVNVIPLNAVEETGLSGTPPEGVAAFVGWLKEHGLSATKRREMGTDIGGACGQLRRRVDGGEKR